MTANSNRAYATVIHALQLGKEEVTILEETKGGHIFGKMQMIPGGPQHYIRKHLGRTLFQDFTIQIGMSMTPGLFDWIAASWTAKPLTRNGAVLECDSNLNINARRVFSEARINRVAFPAMDASSKEPGYITVRFTPKHTKMDKGGGQLTLKELGRQKLWRTAHFRLDIDGLDTTSVRRVAPFQVMTPIGPRKINFPNLNISLDLANAQSWVDWHRDCVIQGTKRAGCEKNGTLRFLAPDLETELARIDFYNLGIFGLAKTNEVGQVATLTAMLYCEWMTLHLGKGL